MERHHFKWAAVNSWHHSWTIGVYVWTLDFCYFNVLSWSLKKSVSSENYSFSLWNVSFLVFQIWQTHISLPITQSIQVNYNLSISPPQLFIILCCFFWIQIFKENSTSHFKPSNSSLEELSLMRRLSERRTFEFLLDRRYSHYGHRAGTWGAAILSASAVAAGSGHLESIKHTSIVFYVEVQHSSTLHYASSSGFSQAPPSGREVDLPRSPWWPHCEMGRMGMVPPHTPSQGAMRTGAGGTHQAPSPVPGTYLCSFSPKYMLASATELTSSPPGSYGLATGGAYQFRLCLTESKHSPAWLPCQWPLCVGSAFHLPKDWPRSAWPCQHPLDSKSLGLTDHRLFVSMVGNQSPTAALPSSQPILPECPPHYNYTRAEGAGLVGPAREDYWHP